MYLYDLISGRTCHKGEEAYDCRIPVSGSKRLLLPAELTMNFLPLTNVFESVFVGVDEPITQVKLWVAGGSTGEPLFECGVNKDAVQSGAERDMIEESARETALPAILQSMIRSV